MRVTDNLLRQRWGYVSDVDWQAEMGFDCPQRIINAAVKKFKRTSDE